MSLTVTDFSPKILLYHWWTTLPELFETVTIMCIFFGVIGNTCFCLLFGNSKTRIYNSRDALYFRWLSTFDMLVSVVVLPYSICYEARLVNNRAVCKILEFIRHILIYSSHMMLVAYSLEFPRRISYEDGQVRVKKALVVVIVLACTFSVPSLFLYDVAQLQPQVHKKAFCQMIISFNRDADEADFINPLRVCYYSSFCLSYTVAMVLFLFKAMHYYDNLSLRHRRSVGVHLTECSKMRPLGSLKANRWRHRVLRHSQTGCRVVLAEYLDSTIEDRFPVKYKEASNESQQDLDSVDLQTSETVIDNSTRKAANLRSRNQDDIQENSDQIFGSSVDGVNMDSKSYRNSLTITHNLKLKHDGSRKHPATHIESNNTPNTDPSFWAEITSHFSVMIDVKHPSAPKPKGTLSCGWNKKQRRKSNLKQTSPELLRIESYKKPLMSLIALDLVIILIALTAYFLLGEHAGIPVLNLIHMKSVFSFYLVSLSHPGLRKAIWKLISSCCTRYAKKGVNTLTCRKCTV